MTKNSGANHPDKLIRTPDKLQKNRGLFKAQTKKMTSILLMGKTIANTKNVVYKPSSNRFLNTPKGWFISFNR